MKFRSLLTEEKTWDRSDKENRARISNLDKSGKETIVKLRYKNINEKWLIYELTISTIQWIKVITQNNMSIYATTFIFSIQQ